MADYILTPVVPVAGTPSILTDTYFVNYGGKTGTTSAATRTIAYYIAEQEVVSHIGTYLTATNVTGTYVWATSMPVQLDYGYVNSIGSVSFQTTLKTWVYLSTNDIANGVYIRDSKRGLVDISLNPLLLRSSSALAYAMLPPYQVVIGYNAGLPTTINTKPDFLWALTMAAQLVLNEMDVSGFLANETPGGVGVQKFTNELYSETRTPLGHSIFGSSPIAQQIVRILSHYRSRAVIKFH